MAYGACGLYASTQDLYLLHRQTGKNVLRSCNQDGKYYVIVSWNSQHLEEKHNYISTANIKKTGYRNLSYLFYVLFSSPTVIMSLSHNCLLF